MYGKRARTPGPRRLNTPESFLGNRSQQSISVANVSDGGVCLVYLSQAIASVHEEAMGIPFLFCTEWNPLMVHDSET